MTERFCLRCDWTGETDEPACPRCGAPLYRLESETPAEPSTERVPEASADAQGTNRETARRDAVRGDDEVQRPVTPGERGRWRVIALALTLTAVVAFALTRGGESNPESEQKAKGAAPTGPAGPSPSTGAALPACSDDPASSKPAFPEPADSVPGATADYLFQGSLSSSIGNAPDLVPVEDGSSIFTVDGRTGTIVLRFAGGRGLALVPTTGVIRSTEYTIEVLFRLDLLSGYRKILDFKDGAADDGLYLQDGCLTFFPKELSGMTSIGTDTYVQVVLTRDGAGRVVGYVNGVRQFAFVDRRGLAQVNAKSTLRLFVDDHTTTGEDSSGAVSQIRLFDESLGDDDVAALACSELAIADATLACRESR